MSVSQVELKDFEQQAGRLVCAEQTEQTRFHIAGNVYGGRHRSAI